MHKDLYLSNAHEVCTIKQVDLTEILGLIPASESYIFFLNQQSVYHYVNPYHLHMTNHSAISAV